MSKIQDALRKLQNEAAPDAAASHDGTAERTQSVAKLAPPKERKGSELMAADEGHLLHIDNEALRRAGYLATVDQERHIAEQYRILKRPLIDNAMGKGAYMDDDANLIMVTSALPGDGKTFNCINLALSMAVEKDVSVLLVDADVAKRHISQLFGVEDQVGLNDAAKDENLEVEKAVIRTDIPGLRVLPAGSRDEHATELLASRRMRNVINKLSRSFSDRVVIFDSPPILATSEARVLANLSGQIVMVVCAGVTPQQAVLDGIDSIGSSKAISLIFNQSVSGSGDSAYGRYGYGYGFDY